MSVIDYCDETKIIVRDMNIQSLDNEGIFSIEPIHFFKECPRKVGFFAKLNNFLFSNPNHWRDRVVHICSFGCLIGGSTLLKSTYYKNESLIKRFPNDIDFIISKKDFKELPKELKKEFKQLNNKQNFRLIVSTNDYGEATGTFDFFLVDEYPSFVTVDGINYANPLYVLSKKIEVYE